jgi:hypothetical protein
MNAKECPILFSAPMVRAILEGRKTQTRRVLRVQPTDATCWTGVDGCGYWPADDAGEAIKSPYGVPGDRLWVRETWTGTFHIDSFHVAYAADGSEKFVDAPTAYILPKAALKPSNWVTPLFMPRWASRITLELVEVRVQRLQDISEDDARAEGIHKWTYVDCDGDPRLDGALYHGTGYHWDKAHPTDQYDNGYASAVFAFRNLWDSINASRGFGWDTNPWVWALTFRRAL